MSKSNSLALHYAHELFKSEQKIMLAVQSIASSSPVEVLNWKDCVKMGWYYVTFRRWLNNGVVQFSFQKKDGQIRSARATTCLDLIPKEDWPKEVQRDDIQCTKDNFKSIAFYDIDKKAWRAFSIDKWIGFVSIKTLSEQKEKA